MKNDLPNVRYENQKSEPKWYERHRAPKLRLCYSDYESDDVLDGLLDNGASRHVACKRDFHRLSNIRMLPSPIVLETANGETQVDRVATWDLGRGLILRNVLLVPNSTASLISIGCLEDQGYTWFQGSKEGPKGILRSPKGVQIPVIRHGVLYFLRRLNHWSIANMATHLIHEFGTCPVLSTDDTKRREYSKVSAYELQNTGGLTQAAKREHERNGHMPAHPECEICIRAKMISRPAKKLSRKHVKNRDRPGLFSADLIGPMPMSIHGHQYILNVVENKTRYSMISTIPNKESDTVYESMKRMFAQNEIKHLHTDGGGEFKGEVSKWLLSRNVSRSEGARHNHSQNSIVERRNRTLCGTMRCLLLGANAPDQLWDTAAHRANTLINRTSRKIPGFAKKVSPYFAKNKRHVENKDPPFGSKVFYYVPESVRDNKHLSAPESVS